MRMSQVEAEFVVAGTVSHLFLLHLFLQHQDAPDSRALLAVFPGALP
jgi:hypothetical protein